MRALPAAETERPGAISRPGRIRASGGSRAARSEIERAIHRRDEDGEEKNDEADPEGDPTQLAGLMKHANPPLVVSIVSLLMQWPADFQQIAT